MTESSTWLFSSLVTLDKSSKFVVSVATSLCSQPCVKNRDWMCTCIESIHGKQGWSQKQLCPPVVSWLGSCSKTKPIHNRPPTTNTHTSKAHICSPFPLPKSSSSLAPPIEMYQNFLPMSSHATTHIECSYFLVLGIRWRQVELAKKCRSCLLKQKMTCLFATKPSFRSNENLVW